MNERPLVGIAVCFVKDGKILLGKRKGVHAPGDWAFVGGHLEYNELCRTCASRESMEEVGLFPNNLRFWDFTEDFYPETGRHYITLIYLAETVGEPELREPDKCESWEWFDLNKLPTPLMSPVAQLLQKWNHRLKD